MSTRTEISPEQQRTALALNSTVAGIASTRQTTLLALCDTLDAAVAGSSASANATLLAAALAVRTSCALEAATFANVCKDVTNPRLT